MATAPTQTVSKHIPHPESALSYLGALTPPSARAHQKRKGRAGDLRFLKDKHVLGKREILTSLLAKELSCDSTAAKHDEICPHTLPALGWDPADASSLIAPAFPLTTQPLPA